MARSDYETPQAFFDSLDREFGFTLDVCATPETAKCRRFFTPEDDGLKRDWTIASVIWMNPPYDKSIGAWVKKAYETSQRGRTVVALIRGRGTDTKMWHAYIMKASEMRFVLGRLHFSVNKKEMKSPNISSVVVVFRPFCTGPPTTNSIGNGR